MNKNFDITNTIDVEELAKRWGVTKKTIDNRRYRGQGPSYYKIHSPYASHHLSHT